MLLFEKPEISHSMPNYINHALFFIGIGTLAEARSLVKILAQHRADTLRESGADVAETTEDTAVLQGKEINGSARVVSIDTT